VTGLVLAVGTVGVWAVVGVAAATAVGVAVFLVVGMLVFIYVLDPSVLWSLLPRSPVAPDGSVQRFVAVADPGGGPVGWVTWLARVMRLREPVWTLLVGCVVDRSVRRTRAALLGGTAVEDETVTATVTRLARQLDVPAPNVRVRRDPRPLCYTLRDGSGILGGIRREGEACVVVTPALVERLDEDELEAVLAHELAHVANDDLRLLNGVLFPMRWADEMIAVAGRRAPWFVNPERTFSEAVRDVAGGVTGARAWGAYAAFGLFRLVTSTGMVLVALCVRVLGAATLAVFARGREYDADRGAAAATGDPGALAGALESLAADTTAPPERDARSVVAVDIVPSATRGLVGLLSLTHPPTERRIERLREFVDGSPPA